MSESTAEPDVERDDAQVAPQTTDEFVGRAGSDVEGDAGETGAEARAEAANDPIEGR